MPPHFFFLFFLYINFFPIFICCASLWLTNVNYFCRFLHGVSSWTSQFRRDSWADWFIFIWPVDVHQRISLHSCCSFIIVLLLCFVVVFLSVHTFPFIARHTFYSAEWTVGRWRDAIARGEWKVVATIERMDARRHTHGVLSSVCLVSRYGNWNDYLITRMK